MQASSMEFLGKNGFEFEKWLKEGVDWIKEGDEMVIRESLEWDLGVGMGFLGRRAFGGGGGGGGWMKGLEEGVRKELEGVLKRVEKWWKGKDKKMVVEEYEGLERKDVFFGVLREKYREVSFEKISFGHDDTCLCLERCRDAGEAKKKIEIYRRKEQEEYIERRIRKHRGFRNVVDLIREAKKPVVMHNCLLDLTKLVQNFVVDLPETLEDFRQVVDTGFGSIYDTKFIAAELGDEISWFKKALNAVGAGPLVEQYVNLSNDKKVGAASVKQYPLISRDDARETDSYVEYVEDENVQNKDKKARNSKNDKKKQDHKNSHNAGFDAFTTGKYFLQLLKVAKSQDGEEAKQNHVEETAKEQQERLLLRFKNKISLSGCGGYSCIDLKVGSEEQNYLLNRRDALVLSGVKPEKAGDKITKRRYDQIIRQLLEGTRYKAERRSIGQDRRLLILEHRREQHTTQTSPKPSKVKSSAPAHAEKAISLTSVEPIDRKNSAMVIDNQHAVDLNVASNADDGTHKTPQESNGVNGMNQLSLDHQQPYDEISSTHQHWIDRIYGNAKRHDLVVKTYRESLLERVEDAAASESSITQQFKRRRLL